MKLGAFSPCDKCGFIPESPEDMARSILLSDHNMDADRLSDAGRRIAQGDAPALDEAAVAEMGTEFEELLKQAPRGWIGCLIIQWVLIGIIVVLFIVAVTSIWYLAVGP